MTYETSIVIGDLHIPYHEKDIIKSVIKFIRDFKPNRVIVNGDLIDFYDASRFAKVPTRFLSDIEIQELKIEAEAENRGYGYVVRSAFQREINEAYACLKQIREAVPRAEIIYIYGNHEYRLSSFVVNNSSLFYDTHLPDDPRKQPIISVEYLLRLDKLKIRHKFSGFVESWIKMGALYIGHFDIIRKHSGWTAKALVEDKQVCLIQNHTHRLGSFYKTPFSKPLVGFENGCLCSLNPRYMQNPNWQHGFSIVYHKKGKDRFHVHQIPIIDNIFIYEGKEYKA